MASRDDDADYRNAVAKNASLQKVFHQKCLSSSYTRSIRPRIGTSQPEVGRTHIAVHHRMTWHADGTLTAPSPHAHARTSRSPFVERLDCSAVSVQIALTPSVSLSRILSANHHFLLPKTHSTFAYHDVRDVYHGVRDVLRFRIDRFRSPSRPNLSPESGQKILNYAQHPATSTH